MGSTTHLHWRWGTFSQKDSIIKFPRFKGEKQFKGTILGGPLLDPFISFQNIRIAIIEDNNLPENILEHSSSPFQNFFKSIRGVKPSPIKKGKNIILYLSFEALRKNYNLIFGGTFFIHGLYFAHEPERVDVQIGSTSEYYENPAKPNSEEWERQPKP